MSQRGAKSLLGWRGEWSVRGRDRALADPWQNANAGREELQAASDGLINGCKKLAAFVCIIVKLGAGSIGSR